MHSKITISYIYVSVLYTKSVSLSTLGGKIEELKGSHVKNIVYQGIALI